MKTPDLKSPAAVSIKLEAPSAMLFFPIGGDDPYALDEALAAGRAFRALRELDDKFRAITKYGNDDEPFCAQRARDMLWEAIKDNEIREMIHR